jgi:glutathione synthase/RimK-type ligase-like ATP-grasp enzyme
MLTDPHVIGFATSSAYHDLTADDRVLASALERRGVQVVPVVWTEAAPEQIDCDLLVVRSVWDYHLRPQDFLAWINEAARRVRVVNSPEIVRWNMDKHYLAEVEAAGFSIPKTLFLQQRSAADLAGLMKREGLSEAVVKPAISASAFETHRIRADGAATLNDRINELLNSRAMLVQEYVPEIATSGEWSLIFAGRELTHAVSKLPKSGDFRVQEERGGRHRAAEAPAEARRLAEEVLARFAPDALYCRADIVMRSRGPTLMELELIEPSLHFAAAPTAAEVHAEGIKQLLATGC